MTVRAIYENGVFRPTEPVSLPDKSEVELDARLIAPNGPAQRAREEQAQRDIFEVLSRRYDTGQTDAAARHNEHQP